MVLCVAFNFFFSAAAVSSTDYDRFERITPHSLPVLYNWKQFDSTSIIHKTLGIYMPPRSTGDRHCAASLSFFSSSVLSILCLAISSSVK